jgi:hypothetical protein
MAAPLHKIENPALYILDSNDTYRSRFKLALQLISKL